HGDDQEELAEVPAGVDVVPDEALHRPLVPRGQVPLVAAEHRLAGPDPVTACLLPGLLDGGLAVRRHQRTAPGRLDLAAPRGGAVLRSGAVGRTRARRFRGWVPLPSEHTGSVSAMARLPDLATVLGHDHHRVV